MYDYHLRAGLICFTGQDIFTGRSVMISVFSNLKCTEINAGMRKGMKKYKGLTVLAFAVVLFFLSFTGKASAEEELYIPDWVADAYLMENGDLKVSEDITFEFNEKFNGVYRDIMLNKTSGVADIEVQEIAGGGIKDYSRAETAKNGAAGVFTVSEDKSKVLIKIFSPSENEKKTFRINYTVKNVSVRYNDTGELYYQFLGDGNKTSIGSFTVKLHLPEQDTDNKVRVFAHGPSSGKITKISSDLYQMQVINVPSNIFIEGRILFPKEFIALSDNYQNTDRYSAVIQEETAIQRKYEEKRERKEAFGRLIQKITFGATASACVIFILVLFLCRRKKKPDTAPSADIPEDCTPAIASLITGTFAGSNTIYATILNLIRKDYIRMSGEEESSGFSDDQSFVMYKIKGADSSLLSHERFLLHWLFHSIGDGNSVRSKDIEYYGKHSSAEFVKQYTAWKNKVKANAVKEGYYDKGKTKLGIAFVILSIALMVLALLSLINGSVASLFSFIAAIVIMTYGFLLFYRLSDYGYYQYKSWINFITYIKKHPSALSKAEVLNSSDLSLIYALSLNAVRKKIHIPSFSYEAYSMDSWIFWYIIYTSSDNHVFQKSFNSSFEGIGASVSTDSSFSGGGGGGAGGGGAGGF